MLSLEQRQPLASAESAKTLQRWLEHLHAPQWNIECGDRLDAARLQIVHEFARVVREAAPRELRVNEVPSWAHDFTRYCARQVPFYRERLARNNLNEAQLDWQSIGFCARGDLAREVWNFVPDNLKLDDLIVYFTSGTTGSEVFLPASFEWASFYLPLFEQALKISGVSWNADVARVAIATIAAQEHTLTFASLSSYWNDNVAIKVNLHPSQWRQSDAATRFLNEANPQILAGDPVSLQTLAESDFAGAPVAVFTSALQLSPTVRQSLHRRFACPVIDIYSSNESGPLCCSDEGQSWHLLSPDILLEIVREDGSVCEEGERGEIVISSRRNKFLPLLRYRTGDFAAWHNQESETILRDFEGRAPVWFRAKAPASTCGAKINSIDITHALHDLALSEFSLHQNADWSLHFRFRGPADEEQIRHELQRLFPNTPLQIERVRQWPRDNRKMLRYSSDIPDSA